MEGANGVSWREVALLLFMPCAFAATKHSLISKIDTLIQHSPAVQHGNFGFIFEDVETGKVLAQRNSSTFFTPASNTKLYTTALALVRLGPNYTFRTQLKTDGPWLPGNSIISDLQLVGGGDPNLSGRVLPYALHSVDMDQFAALRELAGKLAASGVREVNGDVTGVSTRYPGNLYPDGWTVDDTAFEYGAPVTALALNDNAVSLIVCPTTAGELAEITLDPATEHLTILNEVVTDESGKTQIHITRNAGSSEIKLSGTIGHSEMAWRQDVAIEDPALFAAEALINALEEQNITVHGIARSQYSEMPIDAENQGATLAVHDSAPLWQDLQVIHKVSQNLHAEMLFREVAYSSRRIGTLEAARAERDDFLKQISVTHQGSGVALDDGSGLARQDLTTPEATVALLRYMWQSSDRDLWIRTLPIGGIDGSLERRFKNIRGAERVHAKTGSISHVNSLSGYIHTDRGRWVAFSVIVNSTTAPASQVRTFIDNLCAIFLNE